MTETATSPALNVGMVFYYGVKEIAAFLRVNEHTARRWLREGKLPAKKDQAGRWVMTNVDYYLSLQG